MEKKDFNIEDYSPSEDSIKREYERTRVRLTGEGSARGMTSGQVPYGMTPQGAPVGVGSQSPGGFAPPYGSDPNASGGDQAVRAQRQSLIK